MSHIYHTLTNTHTRTLSLCRAQRQQTNANPEALKITASTAPTDPRVLEGIAPPSRAEGPRGRRGRSLGLRQFPAPGSSHPGRPGPQKGSIPLPKRCSICYSLTHRKPACPDAMVSDIESELATDDPAIAARELLSHRLFAACKMGNATQVDELVAAGADVNAHDQVNLSPLLPPHQSAQTRQRSYQRRCTGRDHDTDTL